MFDFPNVSKIPFAKESFANLIFVPVQLNDTGVTAFFDTGAGMSFVTKTTADQIGIAVSDQIKSGGNNNGDAFSFPTGLLRHFRIGAMEISHMTVGILEDEAFDFGTDEENHSFPAAMILGWDIISQFCWHFHMQEKWFQVRAGGYMPKSNLLSWDRFVILPITYAGEELPVGLDCGHTETLLDSSWLSRLPEAQAAVERIQGIGSVKEEQINKANSLPLQIGTTEITLSDIDILPHNIHGAKAGTLTGLLGADVLQACEWTIDYRSKYFSIERE